MPDHEDRPVPAAETARPARPDRVKDDPALIRLLVLPDQSVPAAVDLRPQVGHKPSEQLFARKTLGITCYGMSHTVLLTSTGLIVLISKYALSRAQAAICIHRTGPTPTVR